MGANFLEVGVARSFAYRWLGQDLDEVLPWMVSDYREADTDMQTDIDIYIFFSVAQEVLMRQNNNFTITLNIYLLYEKLNSETIFSPHFSFLTKRTQSIRYLIVIGRK